MASRNLGTLTVDLVAKVGGFERGMGQAERTAKKRAAEIEKTAKRIGLAVGAAFSAAGAIAAAGIKRAIDAADAIDNMSQRTGISVEALSRLEVAAKLSDTSIESLQKAIVKLSQAQLEAQKGTADQVALFEAFGLGIEDLNSMSPDMVLKKVADGFQNIEDPGQKAALAMRLFGKAGVELIPLLNEGSEGLEKFDDLSDQLGNTLSKETAVAAAEFNDKIDILQIGLDGVFRKAAGDLLPTLNALAEKFNDPAFRDGIAAIVTGAATAVIKLVELASALGNVAKFAGEEVAARLGNTVATDTARVEDRINRLKTTIAAVSNTGIGNPLAFLDASELVPGDFVSKTSTVLARLQGELDKEENKLKIGVELNTAAAFAAQSGGAPPSGGGPETASEDPLKAYIRLLEEQAAAAAAASAATATAKAGEAEARKVNAEAARRESDEIKAQQKLAEQVFDQQQELRAAAAEEKRLREEAMQAGKDIRDDLLFELELMKLTNAERFTAIQLRGLDSEAIKKYGAEIAQLNEQLEQQAQVTEALDVVRGATQGLFSDLMDGSKSAKDAFKDFVDSILDGIAQIVARNLTESLFGSFGSTGGGAGGGGLASLFGSFFGGGRAMGGPVSGNRIYEVGEKNRPELLHAGGKQYLIPGNNGRVTPGGGGGTTNVTFVLPGRNDIRTEAQRQVDLARATQRQTARGTA